MPYPELQQAPTAIAIDIGTSSVRAVLFDATGAQIYGSEHKERYRPIVTPDGGSMVDALQMRHRVRKCVHRVVAKASTSDIEIVGISCFWHSLLGLDSHGNPITPVYMWSDSRSRDDAAALADEVDAEGGHQRTGCRMHSSYWPAKLRWLKRTDPSAFSQVHQWCSLPDWIFRPEDGELVTSLCMASGTGLLLTNTLDWDDELLAATDVHRAQLPRLVDRDPVIQPDKEMIPPDLNARWYPALGDGAAANIGAGAVGSDRVALTIGTSGAIRVVRNRAAHALPPSLWRYLIDAHTEAIGGALSNGGNMLAWIASLTKTQDRVTLLDRAARIAPDSHGLTVLPFFAGERAPSWQDTIAGTITGMTLDTDAADIYRALLEATAERFSSMYDALLPFVDRDHHQIIASGGALLQAAPWCQIMADALGHPVSALQSRAEASARGAVIAAQHSAGFRSSLRTDPDIRRVFTPNAERTDIYRNARARLERLEQAMHKWKNSHQ